jgi:hypothetical protein
VEGHSTRCECSFPRASVGCVGTWDGHAKCKCLQVLVPWDGISQDEGGEVRVSIPQNCVVHGLCRRRPGNTDLGRRKKPTRDMSALRVHREFSRRRKMNGR